MITLVKETKYTDYHKVKLDFTSAIFDKNFPCTIYIEMGYTIARFNNSDDLQKLINLVMNEPVTIIDDSNTLVMNSTKMEIWIYRNDHN